MRCNKKVLMIATTAMLGVGCIALLPEMPADRKPLITLLPGMPADKKTLRALLPEKEKRLLRIMRPPLPKNMYLPAPLFPLLLQPYTIFGSRKELLSH